jgi:AhpD family alkylhydroperoxidase
VPVRDNVNVMSKRIQLTRALPEAYKHLIELHQAVEKAAADAGLDQRLIELVKIRASQLNGCAFCVDMHTNDARKLGETERRIFLLSAWWETDLYTEQERAALTLTEAMTKLSQVQDVPDDVYAEATSVFTEEQYVAVAWAATVINTFNRLGVTSHKPLPKAHQ